MPIDMVHAPDGRSWYETLLAEAEKRGRMESALQEILDLKSEDMYHGSEVSHAHAIARAALGERAREEK